jgi:putative OPT family oligopeptide transporter
MSEKKFQPFIAPETQMKEFTLKAVLVGSAFGIIFGASTVYLALKAGLTVSASIPIAVMAIALSKLFLRTTILENNIIQTTGSAGESIAAGVVFTLPGFLFLITKKKHRKNLVIGQFLQLGSTLRIKFSETNSETNGI